MGGAGDSVGCHCRVSLEVRVSLRGWGNVSQRTVRAMGRAAYLVPGVGRAGDTAGAGWGVLGAGAGAERVEARMRGAECRTPERTERRPQVCTCRCGCGLPVVPCARVFCS